MYFRPALLILLFLAAPVGAADSLRGFLDSYCVKCHNDQTQKGERRFDAVALTDNSVDLAIDLRDILDQLILVEMPPPESKQPSMEERQRLIGELTTKLEVLEANKQSTGQRAVLRRMNRREYLNTVSDLFDIDMSMFDPTTKFPRDQTVENFDTIGDGLVTSSFLLHQYFEAANTIVEKVIERSETISEKSWTFGPPFRQQPEVDQAHGIAFDHQYLCLYECPNSEQPEGAFGPLLEFSRGVPTDGYYEIKVTAEAKNRSNPYDAKIIGVDPEEPMRLGIVPGNIRLGRLHERQPYQKVLAEVTVPDDATTEFTFRIWLDKGFSPRFIFPNGMLSIRQAYSPLINRYRDLLPDRARKSTGIVANRINLFSHGYVPHIRIHEVKLRGPLAEHAPPLPFRVASLGELNLADVRDELTRLASLAYRRPATTDEIDRLLEVYDSRIRQGSEAQEAFQDSIKAALCSPGFLYLQSPRQPDSQALSPHELASRLSYFLWSTMPDQELRRLADSGELVKPEVLLEQTRRLLADARSDVFVESFLDSWLNLRSLGDMAPAREAFRQYYSRSLQDAMRRETFLFAKDLLNKDQSVLAFIEADYSFVNRPLAKLYGLDDVVPGEGGEQFRRVTFTDRNRGGLLGQASILTVTANGIETSPVIRGVWLLENILGTPPSPPPDDVPSIDPDVRGATSIRDLLEKHRQSAACMDCHRKIDPLGFALENFDPIGQWRSKYEKDIPIDAAGVMPSGESFEDMAGLKRILLDRHEFFARMLTERLVSYGCGRRVESADRSPIEAIYRPLMNAKYPFRQLIEAVVLSPTFRSP
jgi:hypothetical protein